MGVRCSPDHRPTLGLKQFFESGGQGSLLDPRELLHAGVKAEAKSRGRAKKDDLKFRARPVESDTGRNYHGADSPI